MKNKLDWLEIGIASLSVLGTFIYVLDDVKVIEIKLPIEPMYLSMICLMGIMFMMELKGE